MAQEKLSVKHS